MNDTERVIRAHVIVVDAASIHGSVIEPDAGSVCNDCRKLA